MHPHTLMLAAVKALAVYCLVMAAAGAAQIAFPAIAGFWLTGRLAPHPAYSVEARLALLPAIVHFGLAFGLILCRRMIARWTVPFGGRVCALCGWDQASVGPCVNCGGDLKSNACHGRLVWCEAAALAVTLRGAAILITAMTLARVAADGSTFVLTDLPTSSSGSQWLLYPLFQLALAALFCVPSFLWSNQLALVLCRDPRAHSGSKQ